MVRPHLCARGPYMMLSTTLRVSAIAFGLIALLAALPARAQTPATNSQAAREAEVDAAFAAGFKAGTPGPAKVALLDQASLNVPADYLFVPRQEGIRILRA